MHQFSEIGWTVMICTKPAYPNVDYGYILYIPTLAICVMYLSDI